MGRDDDDGGSASGSKLKEVSPRFRTRLRVCGTAASVDGVIVATLVLLEPLRSRLRHPVASTPLRDAPAHLQDDILLEGFLRVRASSGFAGLRPWLTRCVGRVGRSAAPL
jgi:hypothetical protein